MKIAVLFPGQGSQYLGMGQEFIETDSNNASLVQMAEEICGTSLGSLIKDGPMEELTRNANLQPAITLTNLICWRELKKQLGDTRIHSFAGHSLGEYSALHAAGVISQEDTLRLVARRGSLMEREGIANPGGMRAVLGLNILQIEEILAGYTGEGVVTAANHNTPQQIVLSGSLSGLDEIGPAVESAGGKIIPLNVSVANHSQLVAGAVPDFSEFISQISFHSPISPVYLNVSGKTVSDPDQIRQLMANQIVSRVRWCEIISTMLDDGVDTFIEVGPKTVLKGMMRKITPKGVKVTSLQCDTPKSLAACIEKIS